MRQRPSVLLLPLDTGRTTGCIILWALLMLGGLVLAVVLAIVSWSWWRFLEMW